MSIGTTRTRPATAADIRAYLGQETPYTIRATVLEKDGEVVGIAGYHLMGNFIRVFSESKADIPKMTIWREARKFMAEMAMPAVCEASPGSEPFLERLGWVSMGNGVYQWLP